MQVRWVMTVMCALLLTAFVAVRAEDKPADESKKDVAKAKVVQPWSKLSGLTDDQKAKIKEIHAKANDEIKAIKEKEKADIMALLTDEQKEELKKAMEAEATAKKTKAAAPTDEKK
jgi:Spy/CpxP family protein refolding chaperone